MERLPKGRRHIERRPNFFISSQGSADKRKPPECVAIGTGKTATFEQAEEVCAAIRATVAEVFNQAAADAIRIQYGGSVKPATIAGLMEKPNVDGALVGGASLKAKDFSEIVKF